MSARAFAPDAVSWRLKAFGALTVYELYALLQLRAEVFVLEQVCLFQDLDGSDAQALHVLGHVGEELVAYARCFGPGVKFAEASIGRVVTRGTFRAGGLGHVLIKRSVAATCDRWGRQPIRIGAQARLKRFYEGHGFEDVGVPYIEDGIDHLEMVWRAQATDTGKQK